MVIGILLFGIAPVSADEHIISPGINAIRDAIAITATDGDTILLNQGIYTEFDIPVTKNITIGANPADSANSGNTFIDADGDGRIFIVTGGYNLTIDNLTLRNGQAPKGDPAEYAQPGGAGGSGGCIFSDGLVTVTSSNIHYCRAGEGGDGYPGSPPFDAGTVGGDGGNGGAIFTSDEAVIDATTISHCYAGNGGPYGYLFEGTGATGGYGGAIYVMNFLTITSSSITDCRAGDAGTSPADGGAGGNGGGIYTANYTYPVSYMTMGFTTITNCSAGKAGDGSSANDGGNGGSGGGIYSTWPTTVTSSTISGCNATSKGQVNIGSSAAVDGMGGAYGGFNYGGTLTLENSTLTGNWAPVGGGIGLEGQGDMTVTSSNISSNSAPAWGAIYYWGGPLFATSSNFVGNSGGAIKAYNGQLHLNRFYNNVGMAVQTQYAGEIGAENNWWGFNSGSLGNTSVNVTYSPWLLLCATAAPPVINLGDTSAIRANLTFNNASADTSAFGFVPDAIPFAYAVTAGSGSVVPVSGGSLSGKNETRFSPADMGISTIRTTVDGQSVYTDVIVPVLASFEGTPISGPAPHTVQFRDTSGSSTLLSWNWSFGDGTWFNTTDNLQRNASYTYPFPGTYTVSLTIADAATSDTSTRTNYITVLIPPPTVTGITPGTGVNATTVSITNLSGSYFNTTHTPVTVKLNRTGFTDITADDVTIIDTTNITCTFDLTGRQAGPWNVVVTNPDNQEGMLAGGFEIQTTTPSVTSIDPTSGFNSSTVDITNLGGTGFWTGSSTTDVVLRRSGYTDIGGSVVTVLTETQIACTLDLTGHAAGLWDVVVTNPDGKTATLPAAFEIQPPIPSVTAITPASGVNTTTVSITNLAGSGFWPGSTTVVILNRTGYPDTIAAGDIMVIDSTHITCTFDLTGQQAGPWNVVVTNPDGQVAMLTNGFWIQTPGPGITSITPASGVNTTTVSITHLAGSYFNTTHTPVSVRLNRTGFTDITADDVTVIDTTNITCTFDLTGRQAGPWNVVVTNPDNQEGMLAGGFEIQTTTPSVTSIDPTTGFNSSSLKSMTIDGSGFWPGSSTTGVVLRRSGFTDIGGTNITVLSPAQITCTFDLTGHAAGPWDIVVTNPDGKTATLPGAFEIFPPVPAVTAITPASGVNITTIDITNLAGSGFWPGSLTGVILNGTGYADITATDVTVVDGTTITCRFNIAGELEGFRNVVVTNPDGQVAMLTNGFRIRAPGPVISTITPAYGVNVTTIDITNLAGSGFWTTGTTNVFLNRTGHTDITATDITVVDGTTITCRFNIAGQEEGLWNVVVTNPDGQDAVLTDGFRIRAPAPVVTTITPTSGVNSTTVSITNLAGTGFWTSGTTNIFMNRTGYPDTIMAGDIMVIDSMHIACTFDLTGQEAGLRNIVVTNPDGQEAMLADGFTILIPGPGITGMTPSSGYNTSVINITRLAGTDFWTTGTTVVFLNRTGSVDIVATNVTVIDRTGITCLLDLTGQDVGLWNVVVINPDGQEIMLANGFRIKQAEVLTPTPKATLDTSDNDDGFPTSTPTETIIPPTTASLSNITENVTVNIGGSSAFSRAVVSGTGITGLIVTGFVRSTPDDSPLPPGTVYQYADLVPARFNTIRSAEISFSLPQEWLDEQKIAPGSIVLYRRTAGSWNALPTRVLNAKDGTVNYAAASPGFSLFAIAGITADATPVTVATPKEIMNGVVQEQPPAPAVAMDVPVTTQTTAPPAPTTPAGSSAFPVVPALVVLGCAGLIGGGWYVRRWWIRQQNPALFAEYE
jgi:PKD repeat protein